MNRIFLIHLLIFRKVFILCVILELNTNFVDANFCQIINYITIFEKFVRVMTQLLEIILELTF